MRPYLSEISRGNDHVRCGRHTQNNHPFMSFLVKKYSTMKPKRLCTSKVGFPEINLSIYIYTHTVYICIYMYIYIYLCIGWNFNQTKGSSCEMSRIEIVVRQFTSKIIEIGLIQLFFIGFFRLEQIASLQLSLFWMTP